MVLPKIQIYRLSTICFFFFFFFNDTATTEIYTLSLHDALPISLMRLGEVPGERVDAGGERIGGCGREPRNQGERESQAGEIAHARYLTRAGSRKIDRKSTRLNSSHANISYAVFCLKKKIINHPR